MKINYDVTLLGQIVVTGCKLKIFFICPNDGSHQEVSSPSVKVEGGNHIYRDIFKV